MVFMQKLLSTLFVVLVFSIANLYASNTKKGLVTHVNQGFDVATIKNGLLQKLIPALGLTDEQKPQITALLTDYLGNKAKILPLLQTGKQALYQTKQTALFNELKMKLNGVLLLSQMNKLMALKPPTNDALNVLSHLFY